MIRRGFQWLVLLALLLAGRRPGRAAWLGTNEVVPGTVLEFRVPLTTRARWMVSGEGYQNVTWSRGGLAVPDGFDARRSWPMLIVSVPSGGSAIEGMRGFTNAALRSGWVVLAADGPPVRTQDDAQTWRWAMLSTVLEHLHTQWPGSRQWPMACAGFSGGAKRSGYIAAALSKENYRVLGLFMGGCNEDRASAGLQTYQPGSGFRSVPVYLSSGNADPIATPAQHEAVRQSLLRSGFHTVRLEHYDGSHGLSQEHVGVALKWFLSLSPAQNGSVGTAGSVAAPAAANPSAMVFRLTSRTNLASLAGKRVLIEGTTTNTPDGAAVLLDNQPLRVMSQAAWKPGELGRSAQVIGLLLPGQTPGPPDEERPYSLTNATFRMLAR